MVSIAADATVSTGIDSLRRAGWLLIASMLTFVVVLIYVGVGGAAFSDETDAAAKAEGSTIHTLSAEAQARIANEHTTYWIVSGVAIVIPFIVFVLGLREVRESLRTPRAVGLATAAWWAGVASLAVWTTYATLAMGLLADPDNLLPVVRNLGTLTVPMTTGTAILGLIAMLCAGLAYRRISIAPRMALTVVILSGIMVVAAIVETIATGADTAFAPMAPMLPALLLGIGLVRSKVERAT